MPQQLPRTTSEFVDAPAVGRWNWDIVNDRVTSDADFARLYGVDPELASIGAPLSSFFAGIHPDDRERVRAHRGDGGDVARETAGAARIARVEAHHARGRGCLGVGVGRFVGQGGIGLHR